MTNHKISNLRGSNKMPANIKSQLESANKAHLTKVFWDSDQIYLLKLLGAEHADLILQLDTPSKLQIEAIRTLAYTLGCKNAVRIAMSIKNSWQLQALDVLLLNYSNSDELELAANFDSQEKIFLLTKMDHRHRADPILLKILLITGDISLIGRIAERSFDFKKELLAKLSDPKLDATLSKLLQVRLDFSLVSQFITKDGGHYPLKVRALKKLSDESPLTYELTKLALRFDDEHQVKALELGVSPKLALKFISLTQLQALELGASPELALRFDDEHQVKALELGASPELALKFISVTQLQALELGVSPDLAMRFYEEHQVKALELGVSPDLALKFYTQNSIHALEKLSNDTTLAEKLADWALKLLGRGTTLTDDLAKMALHFYNEYQVEALELGVHPVLAPGFNNNYKLEALKLGVSPDLALKLKKYNNIDALKALSDQDTCPTDELAELALRFDDKLQVKALKLSVSPDLALKFKTYNNIDALKALSYQDTCPTDEMAELALRFDDEHQVKALKLSVSPDLALKFKTYNNIDALKALSYQDTGPTDELAELALSFDDEHQIKALELGVSHELAPEFKTQNSIDALKALSDHDTCPTDELAELALRFDNEHQVKALELGVKPQLALEYKAHYQVRLTIDTINREGAYNYSYAPNKFASQAFSILFNIDYRSYPEFAMVFSTEESFSDLEKLERQLSCDEQFQEYINTRDLDAALHFDKCPYVKNEQLDQRDCPQMSEVGMGSIEQIMSSFSAPCINKLYTELILEYSNSLSINPVLAHMKAKGAQCVDVPGMVSVEDAAFSKWGTNENILFACNLCGELESFVVE